MKRPHPSPFPELPSQSQACGWHADQPSVTPPSGALLVGLSPCPLASTAWPSQFSVQFSLVMFDSATPWTAACQASLSITNSRSLLKLMPIDSVMPSNHLILCRLLLLPSIFPSIRVFSSESVLRIRWLKYWSFSFNISPSNGYSRLVSFRMDWFDLLTDGTESIKSFI